MSLASVDTARPTFTADYAVDAAVTLAAPTGVLGGLAPGNTVPGLTPLFRQVLLLLAQADPATNGLYGFVRSGSNLAPVGQTFPDPQSNPGGLSVSVTAGRIYALKRAPGSTATIVGVPFLNIEDGWYWFQAPTATIYVAGTQGEECNDDLRAVTLQAASLQPSVGDRVGIRSGTLGGSTYERRQLTGAVRFERISGIEIPQGTSAPALPALGSLTVS